MLNNKTSRMMAVLVLLVVATLAWVLNSVAGMRTPSRWIAVLMGLQVATGLSNVVLDWPLLAALLHTGGAGALVVVMTWVVCASRVSRAGNTVQRDGATPAAMHTRSMNVPGLDR